MSDRLVQGYGLGVIVGAGLIGGLWIAKKQSDLTYKVGSLEMKVNMIPRPMPDPSEMPPVKVVVVGKEA